MSDKQKLEACRALYMEGAFDPEIARELGITMARFHELYDSNPAFTSFVDMGRTLAMAYWYEQGRLGLTGKGFNTQLFIFTMKNQYGWADKIETATREVEDNNLDSLKSKIVKAMKTVAKDNPELLSAAEAIVNG